MTETKFLNPVALHTPFGYSHVAEVTEGRMAYISGQIAFGKNGNVVGKGDFSAQVRQAFENLKLAVESVGGTMDDIVKINYYLVDMSRLQELREIRNTYFSDKARMPASTAVGVTKLAHPDLLVEIEAVAAIG